jgi:hypothetical protein
MASRSHCVLDDLLSSVDQKILVMGLPRLRFRDFAWAIEFGEACQDTNGGSLPKLKEKLRGNSKNPQANGCPIVVIEFCFASPMI